MSQADATAADVIPAVTVLQRLLATEREEGRGVLTMKDTLLQAVKKRFKEIEDNPIYCVASILDPR